MKLLSLDTSGPTASAALLDGEKVVAETSAAGPKKHAEILMPMIEKLLDLSGFSLHNLSLIACASGPGSFTGLRIGAACAKGLAYALNVPIAAVPTLDAMAYIDVIRIPIRKPESERASRFRPSGGSGAKRRFARKRANRMTGASGEFRATLEGFENGIRIASKSDAPPVPGSGPILIPMMDARRSQVYTAFYEVQGGSARKLTADMAISVPEVLRKASEYGRETLFLGEGAALHRGAILASGLRCGIAPRPGNAAVSAGLIGLKMAENGELASWEDFSLSYLRKPQAERERAERLAREAGGAAT